jgi:hypothetical protein
MRPREVAEAFFKNAGDGAVMNTACEGGVHIWRAVASIPVPNGYVYHEVIGKEPCDGSCQELREEQEKAARDWDAAMAGVGIVRPGDDI